MKSAIVAVVLLAVLLGLSLLTGWLRNRAMRSLASRWGFRYLGHDLPASFAMDRYPANQIRLAVNVIEGQHGAVPILIFDCVIGQGRNPPQCTVMASHTEWNPFTTDVPPEAIIRSREWTALYRLQYSLLGWAMSVKGIEVHLNGLQASDPELSVRYEAEVRCKNPVG